MTERCPLLTYQFGLPFVDSKIPEFCRDNCEALMDEAANRSKPVEEYDVYPNHHPDECAHDGSIEYGHDALTAIGMSARLYTVVDYCQPCGQEYGEESFQFTCPRT